jgi:hypothetical protein
MVILQDEKDKTNTSDRFKNYSNIPYQNAKIKNTLKREEKPQADKYYT